MNYVDLRAACPSRSRWRSPAAARGEPHSGLQESWSDHITNGCYRLHPVEWNIGEAAGALVSEALRIQEPPRQIRKDPRRLSDFQRNLRAQGFELEWPPFVLSDPGRNPAEERSDQGRMATNSGNFGVLTREDPSIPSKRLGHPRRVVRVQYSAGTADLLRRL